MTVNMTLDTLMLKLKQVAGACHDEEEKEDANAEYLDVLREVLRHGQDNADALGLSVVAVSELVEMGKKVSCSLL